MIKLPKKNLKLQIQWPTLLTKLVMVHALQNNLASQSTEQNNRVVVQAEVHLPVSIGAAKNFIGECASCKMAEAQFTNSFN
ncbi:uncharacterized protein LOC113548710 isoform X2 [Rhopalosiphum maidis]|uniref:uncharacterized protein LOC113548710 isoform X2 n=1 Tax=Rhopalosiphum maidis TaxID=43146 RepID=UPI000EFF6EBB|nr:uncharacterized protein LOC113548710 isoform X2 [Rhopalosiphum maidis]